MEKIKKAKVLGDKEDNEKIAQATDLLRNRGYKVTYVPVSGISEFECDCYQSGCEPIHITNLDDLKKFFAGKKIPRSMWTIA